MLSFQESKRETWTFRDCEIVLDEWPWLKPYIEIEGPDSQTLQHVSLLLGLDWEEGKYGDVMVAYRDQYPNLKEYETVGSLPKVKFDSEPPTFLK